MLVKRFIFVFHAGVFEFYFQTDSPTGDLHGMF